VVVRPLQVIESDCKSCERIHTFIDKKVITIQILNAHHCKEYFKIYNGEVCVVFVLNY
jgi:hypothetical protein